MCNCILTPAQHPLAVVQYTQYPSICVIFMTALASRDRFLRYSLLVSYIRLIVYCSVKSPCLLSDYMQSTSSASYHHYSIFPVLFIRYPFYSLFSLFFTLLSFLLPGEGSVLSRRSMYLPMPFFNPTSLHIILVVAIQVDSHTM